MQKARGRMIAFGLAVVVAAGILVLLLESRGDGGHGTRAAQENLQLVSFQKPQDPGPDPFTRPADVKSGETVAISSGTESPRDEQLRREPAVWR